jgi:hypothetical protein
MQEKQDLAFATFWLGYLAFLIACAYVARYIYINFFQ